MGITFVGHSTSFEIWVFDVNGKRFVARNFSTQTPLKLLFAGAFSEYSGGSPLVKTSGFTISDSTATTATWQWGGKQYKSYWQIEYDDIEDPEATVKLVFGPPVPYSGPPVAPVGTGVVSQNVIQAQQENTGPSGSGYTTQVQPSSGTTTQTPSGGYSGPSGGGGSTRTGGVVSAPNVPYAGPSGTLTAKTETDWVKLGLQIGAAYLLFS